MEDLQGQVVQEDNPTVVHLTTYLLALDVQYDQQASELREFFSRMLEVQLAEAHANVAAVESRETAMAKALKVDEE
jgi:hypothetical protein